MASVVIVVLMLLAMGLVSVLGLPFGMLAWLCIYGLFHLCAKSLLKHVSGD